MSAAAISAGVGLLANVFGSRPQTPGYVKRNYELQNGLIKRGLDLYDQTNLEALDAQALGAYSNTAMQQAMQLLQNYDAKASGAGSPRWKSDTNKGRARSQIGADVGQQLGRLEADLISTRPGRKAALLPNAGAAAGNFPAAAYLDQQALGQQQAEMQGLLDAANLIGTLWPSRGASGTGRNDRFVSGAVTNSAKGVDWGAAVRGIR